MSEWESACLYVCGLFLAYLIGVNVGHKAGLGATKLKELEKDLIK
jgi:hypothetical protein